MAEGAGAHVLCAGTHDQDQDLSVMYGGIVTDSALAKGTTALVVIPASKYSLWKKKKEGRKYER